jgi:hypothetical protein
MVRLVRIVKLYKYAAQAAELKKKAQSGVVKHTELEVLEESRVGAARSEIINRR